MRFYQGGFLYTARAGFIFLMSLKNQWDGYPIFEPALIHFVQNATMKLIIPMAGRGTRLRPHTHVTPKPLLPVVGISMVERIVETFIDVLPKKLDEAVFVLGPDFPEEVYDELRAICARHDMQARFGVQDQALGTAHAVFCAGEHLQGEVISVFADTLFYMDPGVSLDGADVWAWVKHVDDPRRFGVVVKDGDRITDFVEKPKEIISNEALIGIYYIKDGAALRASIQYLFDNDVKGHGEFQITDAFDHMLKQGYVFKTTSVREWLDCGTIPALKETSWVLLAKETDRLHQGTVVDSVLIDPVYVGEGARITGSVVGPNVVVEAGAEIQGSVVDHTIVFADARVTGSVLQDSMVGHHAQVTGQSGPVNIGDHATVGAPA